MAVTGNRKPGPTFDTPAAHRAVTGLESLDDWTPARLVHQIAAHRAHDGALHPSQAKGDGELSTGPTELLFQYDEPGGHALE